MGINNTSNTGNSGLLAVGKQVTPNVSVTIPAYTATGWTAGDYLYQSASGVVGAPSGTVAIGGPITTLQATNVTVNGGLFTAVQTPINPNKTGATYTGPTLTVGSTIFLTEQSSTTTQTSGKCVSLIGGNLVEVFYDQNATTPGYYFIIYDLAGTVITAKTLIQSQAVSGYNNIMPVAYADGSFGVGYYSSSGGNLFVSKKYSSTGVLASTASTSVSNPPRENGCMRAIQLVGGNIVYAFRTNTFYYGIAIFTASNTLVSYFQPSTGYFYTSNSYPQMSFGLYPFTSSQTSVPNGFGMVAWSDNYGSGVYASFTASGSNVAVNTTSGPYSYYSQDLIRLQDGTYIWAGSNGSVTLSATKVTFNANGVPSATGGTGSYSNSYYYNFGVTIVPSLGSGFYMAYWVDPNYLFYVKSTGTTSALSPTTAEANLSYSYYGYNFGITCGVNGSLYYSVANAGSTVYFGGISNQAITNGTEYTATALTPPNYTFLGIAENTTAAGSVGNIIVSGNAIANGSMPNVSGTLAFDSTQTTMFGNKGFVTGRNFTLKGFE